MKRCLVLAFLVLAAGATSAAAFDGDRSGFTLALQSGVGQAEYTQKDPGGDRTFEGTSLATVWRMGYAPTKSAWAYLVNRAQFFEGEGPDDRVQGLGGLGLAWTFAERGLPVYLAAEAGLAVHQNRITSVNEDGFGFAFGVGIELRRHFTVEFSFLGGGAREGLVPTRISAT